MRNSAYIKYHREQIKEDWATPLPGWPSKWIDAVLPAGFGLFYLILVAIELGGPG
jgi:TRAP-type C4-dicarboxylate transport system permease small subunit